MSKVILRQIIRELLIRELQTGGPFGVGGDNMKTPEDRKIKAATLGGALIEIIKKIFDTWSSFLPALVGLNSAAILKDWHEKRKTAKVAAAGVEAETKRKTPMTQVEIDSVNKKRVASGLEPLLPAQIASINTKRAKLPTPSSDASVKSKKIKRRINLGTVIVVAGTAAYIWATSDDEDSETTPEEKTANDDRVTAIFNNIDSNIDNDKFKLEEIENLTDDANITKFNTYIDKIKNEFINNTGTYNGTISTYYGGTSIDPVPNPADFDISHAFAAGKVYENILVNIIDVLKTNLNIKEDSPEYNKLGELVKEAGSTKIMKIYIELNKVAK